MLPVPAVPGCCLVSLYFLCYILCSRSVDDDATHGRRCYPRLLPAISGGEEGRNYAEIARAGAAQELWWHYKWPKLARSATPSPRPPYETLKTGQSILRQTLGRASGENCLYLENRRGKAPLGLCLDFVGEVA